MSTMASQVTNLTIVYSTVYSGANQRKHQSSASLAFVREIHRGPVTSPHKCQQRGKCFYWMTSSCFLWFVYVRFYPFPPGWLHCVPRYFYRFVLKDLNSFRENSLFIYVKSVWFTLMLSLFESLFKHNTRTCCLRACCWHYWPLVRAIYRSPVNSPHKGR